MKLGLKAKLALTSILFAVSLAIGLANIVPAQAAVTNTTPQAKVSFTFDDGAASVINKAAPALAEYGYSGTSYVITKCVGMVTVPNKCAADEDVPYMTWAQIRTLQNTYGWEIGSHGVSHQFMTEINARKLEQEVANSKKALEAQGFSPTSFATPYGDYNDKVLSAIAKYYTNHRPFHDTGYNTWPYNNYLLRVQQVQVGVSVDTVKSYIDQAAADNTWLILVFHDIKDSPSSDPEDYQFSTADLTTIAAYVKSKNIAVTNVSSGLVTSTNPQVDNQVADVVNGTNLGSGWITDAPSNIKVDTSSKGNTPSPTTSVAVTVAPNKNVHLFSPEVAVNSNSHYVVKGYVSLAANSTGTVGFYIDEYDANGNWISGQYLQTINAWYARDISFVYTASSVQVAKAKLQIIITAGTKQVIYVDSIQWLITTAGPAPQPQPEVNLLTNGTFEAGLTGWTTDAPDSIKLDTQNQGQASNPQNSVKVAADTVKNSHLFSAPVAVSGEANYMIKAFVNLTALNSQELAFYIDEYDANGNWISGQYLYEVRALGTTNVSFGYRPSSAQVASASIQVIVPGNSGIMGFVDDVRFVKNT